MPLDDLSPYERPAWATLTEHWERKAKHREVLPPRMREALGSAKEKVGDRASKVGPAVSGRVPDKVKDVGALAVGATDPAAFEDSKIWTVSENAHLLTFGRSSFEES